MSEEEKKTTTISDHFKGARTLFSNFLHDTLEGLHKDTLPIINEDQEVEMEVIRTVAYVFVAFLEEDRGDDDSTLLDYNNYVDSSIAHVEAVVNALTSDSTVDPEKDPSLN